MPRASTPVPLGVSVPTVSRSRRPCSASRRTARSVERKLPDEQTSSANEASVDRRVDIAVRPIGIGPPLTWAAMSGCNQDRIS